MSGWNLHTGGSGDERDMITLVRKDAPQISLEIHVAGLASVIGREQVTQARQFIQRAIDDIQEALDDPLALPGHPNR